MLLGIQQETIKEAESCSYSSNSVVNIHCSSIQRSNTRSLECSNAYMVSTLVLEDLTRSRVLKNREFTYYSTIHGDEVVRPIRLRTLHASSIKNGHSRHHASDVIR